MNYPMRVALGFAAGALLGLMVGLGISALLSFVTSVKPGGPGVAIGNLLSLLTGGFLSGALGGAAIGRGSRPILGYGLAFIPVFALAMISLLAFM